MELSEVYDNKALLEMTNSRFLVLDKFPCNPKVTLMYLAYEVHGQWGYIVKYNNIRLSLFHTTYGASVFRRGRRYMRNLLDTLMVAPYTFTYEHILNSLKFW